MTRVVLSVGTFDLWHAGHVFLLEQCRAIAGHDGRVVAGVNTSEFVARFKAAPPVQTTHERLRIVRACRYVDDVVTNDSESLAALIEEVRPDFLVVGQDWAVRDYYAQIGVDQEWLDDRQVHLLYVPRPAGSCSSTEMKSRVKDHAR